MPTLGSGSGFVDPLKQHLSLLIGGNNPTMKITPQNFLKALLLNNPDLNVSGVNGERIDPLKLSTATGDIREVKVKYLQRRTAADVIEEDNCDTSFINQYKESDITAPRVAKLGFFVDIETMRRYEAAAKQAVQIGDPNVTVLKEMWTQIMAAANGIVSKIDQRLVGDVLFGVNAVTGNNAAKTININKAGNTLDLSSGLLEIANDYQMNEGFGNPFIVGNGLFNKFVQAKQTVSLGMNQAGINIANLFDYNWFLDLNTIAGWGLNEIGVFAPGTIGFVDIDSYVGWFKGPHANSYFTTIMLPVETTVGQPPVMMRFNLQIKEVDCPSTHVANYTSTTTGRGYEIFLMKRYGLWQLPLDAYSDADRMKGTNGALNYVITNNCDGC